MQIENNSGWEPVGQGVLLRAFELLERQSKIVVPEDAEESSSTCDTKGVVVAIGADAWKGATPRAKVGQKVMFTRFAGGVLRGSDGYVYRLVHGDAIYAVEKQT